MYKNILLSLSFAKRDFKERYVGTKLGQLWYLLLPIITIFIYTVIFSDFMKMKLNIIDNSYAYSIYLVPGLLAWTTFTNTITRMINTLDEKINLIKKISVPIYTYYISFFIIESILFILSFILGILFLVIIDYPVTYNFLYLLPVMFFQMIFTFSLGIIFSLFTPFFKDLKEAIPIMLQLFFWMTPIIYLKEMVLDKYPLIIALNPIYYFIEIYQNIFLFSKLPDFSQIIIIIVLAIVPLFLALILYKKLIPTIKDIL